MPLNVQKAREAGYSDGEIADFLGTESKFDVGGARNSGYTDSEIIEHLVTPQKPEVTAGDRVQSAVSGGNEGIATTFGMPVDTALNVWDLAKAGAGSVQGAMTGEAPSKMFDPSERAGYVGSSDWIKQKLGTAGIETDARRPDDLASKALHFGGNLGMSMFMGKGLPGPQGAPRGPLTPRNQALQAARESGYVVPPATANPSVVNKVLESIGGKAATAQEAAVKNQGITDALAKKSVGLKDVDQLVEGVLPTIRKEAAQAYEPIRGVGVMRADSQYAKDLDNILAKTTTAAKSFPGLARNEIDDLVKNARVKAFDSASALDAIGLLRENADKAFRTGDKALGKAYKSVSEAMEGAIERSLSRRGEDGNALLGAFRQARQLIAKTYTVEGALNPTTGQVNARKLASDLGKGKPLTKELKQVAQFAQAFPEAAPIVKGSPAVSALDTGIGAGSAAATGQPWWLVYPLLRQGARKALLSKAGQSALIDPTAEMDPRSAMALLMGANSATQ